MPKYIFRYLISPVKSFSCFQPFIWWLWWLISCLYGHSVHWQSFACMRWATMRCVCEPTCAVGVSEQVAVVSIPVFRCIHGIYIRYGNKRNPFWHDYCMCYSRINPRCVFHCSRRRLIDGDIDWFHWFSLISNSQFHISTGNFYYVFS